MNRWLLLLLLAAVMPCARAHDALQAIDECVARLDPGIDVGYTRITQRCPELAPALLQDPAAAWLPPDWNLPDNQLSAHGLSELRVQLARERQPPAPRRAAPSVERVGSVLSALATTSEQQRGGWWTRFKQWLRRLLTPPRPDGDQESWLARWLADVKLSAATGELLAWTALALVVVLAAGILLNELRVAGLFGQRVRHARGGAEADTRAAQWGLAEISAAEAREQPGLLLDFIATRLAEQGRLPPARACTARELTERARLPDESARASLAQLGAVSDRVRFSGAAVSPELLNGALAGGRRLLAQLDSLPVPGGA